jgi:hypothetical protein
MISQPLGVSTSHNGQIARTVPYVSPQLSSHHAVKWTSLLGITTQCWGHMLILSIKTYIFIVDLIKPVEIQYFVF